MARKAQSDNMLEKMRDQHAQDKVNDRMETGSFPTVRKKPRKDLNRASNKSRLLSSILIALMCALLGFAYMSQINNTKSTYETMDESELVRLLNESNTQISNLEQRKTQLNSQLNSLKSAANEQEQARKIAKQNEETSGLISGSSASLSCVCCNSSSVSVSYLTSSCRVKRLISRCKDSRSCLFRRIAVLFPSLYFCS